MTVREALEQYKGVTIKLGSGNGFVYCAPCDENTPKTIEDMSKKEVKKLKARARNELRKKCEALNSFTEKWDGELRARLDRHDLNTKYKADYTATEEDIRTKWHDDRQAEYEKLIAAIEDYKTWIEELTPYLTREVEEVYKSLRGETVIIFHGRESGKYWTIEEYMKDVYGIKWGASNEE